MAKANAICVKGTVRTEKAGSSLGNNPTEAEAAVAVPAKFVPAVPRLAFETKTFADFGTVAHAYGLKSCAPRS